MGEISLVACVKDVGHSQSPQQYTAPCRCRLGAGDIMHGTPFNCIRDNEYISFQFRLPRFYAQRNAAGKRAKHGVHWIRHWPTEPMVARWSRDEVIAVRVTNRREVIAPSQHYTFHRNGPLLASIAQLLRE